MANRTCSSRRATREGWLCAAGGQRPENAVPQDGDERWQEYDVERKLPDGAAAGNPRNENADKGSPGNPPGPVEEGPVLDPLVGVGGGGAGEEAHLGELEDVIARGFHQSVQNLCLWTDEKRQNEKGKGEKHVAVGQNLDAF